MVEVLIVGARTGGRASRRCCWRAPACACSLVDRATFPRDKLCGDTLNPGSLAMLARHGVTDRVLARGKPIEGMLVTGAPDVKVRGVYGRGLTRAVADAARARSDTSSKRRSRPARSFRMACASPGRSSTKAPA